MELSQSSGPTTLKMWHGTSWENAQRIAKDWFLESDDGLLGPGVLGRQNKTTKEISQNNTDG